MTATATRALILGTVLLVCSPAFAHAGHAGGSMIEGEVITSAADSVSVKTDDGTTKVDLSKDTKVTFGEQAATAAALKPGVHVMVHGSKLPGGGMVGRTIMIEQDGEKAVRQ